MEGNSTSNKLYIHIYIILFYNNKYVTTYAYVHIQNTHNFTFCSFFSLDLLTFTNSDIIMNSKKQLFLSLLSNPQNLNWKLIFYLNWWVDTRNISVDDNQSECTKVGFRVSMISNFHLGRLIDIRNNNYSRSSEIFAVERINVYNSRIFTIDRFEIDREWSNNLKFDELKLYCFIAIDWNSFVSNNQRFDWLSYKKLSSSIIRDETNFWLFFGRA